MNKRGSWDLGKSSGFWEPGPQRKIQVRSHPTQPPAAVGSGLKEYTVPFLVGVATHPRESRSRKEGTFWFMVWGCSVLWWRRHGGWCVRLLALRRKDTHRRQDARPGCKPQGLAPQTATSWSQAPLPKSSKPPELVSPTEWLTQEFVEAISQSTHSKGAPHFPTRWRSRTQTLTGRVPPWEGETGTVLECFLWWDRCMLALKMSFHLPFIAQCRCSNRQASLKQGYSNVSDPHLGSNGSIVFQPCAHPSRW